MCQTGALLILLFLCAEIQCADFLKPMDVNNPLHPLSTHPAFNNDYNRDKRSDLVSSVFPGRKHEHHHLRKLQAVDNNEENDNTEASEPESQTATERTMPIEDIPSLVDTDHEESDIDETSSGISHPEKVHSTDETTSTESHSTPINERSLLTTHSEEYTKTESPEAANLHNSEDTSPPSPEDIPDDMEVPPTHEKHQAQNENIKLISSIEAGKQRSKSSSVSARKIRKRKASRESFANSKPIPSSINSNLETSDKMEDKKLESKRILSTTKHKSVKEVSKIKVPVTSSTPMPETKTPQYDTFTPSSISEDSTSDHNYQESTPNTNWDTLQTESSLSDLETSQSTASTESSQGISTTFAPTDLNNSTKQLNETINDDKLVKAFTKILNSTEERKEIPSPVPTSTKLPHHTILNKPSAKPGSVLSDVSKEVHEHFAPIQIPFDVVEKATLSRKDHSFAPKSRIIENPNGTDLKEMPIEGPTREFYNIRDPYLRGHSKLSNYEDDIPKGIQFSSDIPKEIIIDEDGNFQIDQPTGLVFSRDNLTESGGGLSKQFKEFLKRNGIEIIEPNFTSNGTHLNTTIIIDDKKEIPHIYLEDLANEPQRYQSTLLGSGRMMSDLRMAHGHHYAMKNPKSDDDVIMVPNMHSSMPVINFPPGMPRPYPMQQVFLEGNGRDTTHSIPEDHLIHAIVLSKPNNYEQMETNRNMNHGHKILTKRKINLQGLHAEMDNQPGEISLARLKLKPSARLHSHLKSGSFSENGQVGPSSRQFLEHDKNAADRSGPERMGIIGSTRNVPISPAIPPPNGQTIIFQPRKGEIVFADDPTFPNMGNTYFREYDVDKSLFPAHSSQFSKMGLNYDQATMQNRQFNDKEKPYQQMNNKRIKRHPHHETPNNPTFVYDNTDSYFDEIW